jgi:hypothetical protein
MTTLLLATRRQELANEEAAATPVWLRKPSGLVCAECGHPDDDPAERGRTMHLDCDDDVVPLCPHCQEIPSNSDLDPLWAAH